MGHLSARSFQQGLSSFHQITEFKISLLNPDVRGFEVGDKLKFFKVKFMTRKTFSVEDCKANNPYPTSPR